MFKSTQYIPSYHYSVTTHVHCHVGNNGYVYKPRGNWRHNNKKHLNYHHDKVHNTGVNIKDKSNVPTRWRNINKSNIKTNKSIKNNNFYNQSVVPTKVNTNKNNKTKTNRTNIKTNTNRSNTKININRSNTKPNRNNRSNKINTKKPR